MPERTGQDQVRRAAIIAATAVAAAAAAVGVGVSNAQAAASDDTALSRALARVVGESAGTLNRGGEEGAAQQGYPAFDNGVAQQGYPAFDNGVAPID
ncbi:hypothetical protein ABNF97_14815 [Plantactinospora sp. B6F1]|uniref:hypothetical protein n=1 Tax=Plantactinospora sp. B6F1 TaxID=3158971 RepID=UPI00102C0C5E